MRRVTGQRHGEAERVAAGDTNIVRGLADDEGDASMGLALRWYAENLNSTEFALYYQKLTAGFLISTIIQAKPV